MRIILILTLVGTVWACNSGPEVPTQEETHDWYVGVMNELSMMARRCTHAPEWEERPWTEEERRQTLADLEVMQRMGKAAVDQGADVLVTDFDEYLMTFHEEMSEESWQAIWPEVEAYKVVVERQLLEYRVAAERGGCIHIRSASEVEEWFDQTWSDYDDMASGCTEEQIEEALIDESGALNPTAKYDLARLAMWQAATDAGVAFAERDFDDGEPTLGFDRHATMNYEPWRTIAPEVEAFIKALENLMVYARERLSEVGCLQEPSR